MRKDVCKLCNKTPLYYTQCDTFGCPECDVWTEIPHCDGKACEYFEAIPEKPSLYTGKTEDLLKRNK